jgi:hypothetical protein
VVDHKFRAGYKHDKKEEPIDEKLQDIGAGLHISPQKSLRQLSQETGVSVGSASEATK